MQHERPTGKTGMAKPISKSETIRRMLAQGMTTTEIRKETGFSTSLISTCKWKVECHEHWKSVHRQQAKRRYHEIKNERQR